MAKRNIVKVGEDILRKKCREVTAFDDKLWVLLDDMLETMKDANGVGLAAPQVGILRRVVVIDVGEGPIELVNPVITSVKGKQREVEGCLSVPGYTGIVDRPESITIRGLDREGNHQEFTFEGFKAVVMCHEYDHLDGILYTDKAGEIYRIQAETDEA